MNGQPGVGGEQAWRAVATSPHFAWLREASPETVEKAFLPPVEHMDIDRGMQRPLDAHRRQWRADYAAAKAAWGSS